MADYEFTGTNLLNGYEHGSLADINSDIRRNLGRPYVRHLMPQQAEPVPLNPEYGRPKGRSPQQIITDTILSKAIVRPPIPPIGQGEK